MKLLVKEINIKALVTGDKQARITLETIFPKDIPELAKLAEEMEIDVEFRIESYEEIKEIESPNKEQKKYLMYCEYHQTSHNYYCKDNNKKR